MTGLWVPWRTSVIPFPIKLWVIFSSARVSLPRRNESVETTWADFIRTHMSVLAGTDFFSVEVLTLRGLVTYYVLFFIHLESRKVEIAGMTPHPNEVWMMQIARNVTMDEWGFLGNCRYLIHDRDYQVLSIHFEKSSNPVMLNRCDSLHAVRI